MEEELMELFLVAKKAGDSVINPEVSLCDPEVSRCIDSLKQIKNFPVTYNLLIATQVGKSIRCFEKHSNNEIRTLAVEVIDVWKKLVTGTFEKTENSNNVSNKISKNEAEKITQFVTTYDPDRDKIRQLLLDALSRVADEAHEKIKDQVDACDPSKISVLLESIMFKKMGSPIGVNKVKYRSIIFNMRDKKNPDFRRKILLGEVKLETINSMTSGDMASNERQDEYREIKMKLSYNDVEVTTDPFKCSRCGERKTTYYQLLQTRSADEPTTSYVTCVNCNNRWKFS